MTKQEVRKAWVKALRSGQYNQGKYSLCIPTPIGSQYCCLGILAELAVQQGIVEKNGTFYDKQSIFLSPTIMKWAGLRSSDGAYQGSALSIKNDSDISFTKIADIIESAPPGLFVED